MEARGAKDLGECAFLKEGEYWTIAYDGQVFRLRDAKGLHYLAHLLRQPGDRIAAKSLLASAENQTPEPQDQGPYAERARLAVTKRVKAAIEKIAQHHASLGHHLSTCIKTGHHCAYLTDPTRLAKWTVRL